MIVAEELDADLEKVGFAQAPYDPKYNDPEFQAMLTGGSTSVQSMMAPLRETAAAAREMLKGAAAKRLGVDASELKTEAGFVVHGEQKIPYGELVEESVGQDVPESPPLKDPMSFRYLGKCARRMDIPDKIAGTACFGNDVRVPDMVYAALAWPSAYGATAKEWDEEAALAVPGVIEVMETDTGPAVLAENTWAAWKGRDALAVQWSEGTQPDLSTETLMEELKTLSESAGIVAEDRGDAANLAQAAEDKIDLTFTLPFLAHATIEPMNCTAHVRKDGADIWGPTQYQTGWAQEAATVTGLPVESIAVHTTYAGGGFGRKGALEGVRNAARISKACGKPVQLLYSREEEFHYDGLRPGVVARVQAGLDADGKIAFWNHRTASASVLADLIPFMIAENGLDFTGVEGIEAMDYEIPALRLEWTRQHTPVPIGFWRSVGSSHNCFIRESVIDELAVAAGQDPVAFRLAHLTDARARGVLELAAERYGWGNELPEGHAVGVACDHCFNSYLAHIAEISRNAESGELTFHRIVAAIDCGQTINPLAVTMQVEGAVIMGLSSLVGEAVEFADGGGATKQFSTYPVMRMEASPDSIEVHIVESGENPGGVGEPGLPGVLPAVTNALKVLTGERVTELPLSKQS
eukprot:TRINITY_DN2931_c0_g1_i12.p5 TRINITY_DN2931_c0_g1~~TRINITY_DN2931_c0_g1_i12.p5  ORF type:complete len:637 (+),score=184.04 TRINITY_DN2931_c0_g1_i12:9914-11824(+)